MKQRMLKVLSGNRRALGILLVLLAVEIVLGHANDKADEDAEIAGNDEAYQDNLVCRLVRRSGHPLTLENRLDWCPIR